MLWWNEAFWLAKKVLWRLKIQLKCFISVWLREGSSCGSVGWAVASNTRGPQFESSHRQTLYWRFVYLFAINCIEKMKINKKEAGNGPLLEKKVSLVDQNIVHCFVFSAQSLKQKLLLWLILTSNVNTKLKKIFNLRPFGPKVLLNRHYMLIYQSWIFYSFLEL